MTRTVGARIVAFAMCERFLGAAIVGSQVQLRSTRIDRSKQIERVRLAAWVEGVVTLHEPVLVTLVTDGPDDDLISEAMHRTGRRSFSISRQEIAHVLGAPVSSANAIGATAMAQAGFKFKRNFGFPSPDRPGPRSEAVRYWQMPLLAFGAALAARAVAERWQPQEHRPSP